MGQELGVISFLLDTGLFMGAILLVMKRWTLPIGTFTLIFALNAVAMGFLNDLGDYPLAQVVARAAAGIVADALYQRLRPSAERLYALRLFAFAVPAIIYGFYFLAAHLTAGITWTIHLWAGSIVLAGATGLLLSIVVAPAVVKS